MAETGSIIIDTRVATEGFTEGIESIKKATGEVIDKLSGAIDIKTVADFAKSSLQAASDMDTAFARLETGVEGQGGSFTKAKSFIDDYISDGLVPATNAIEAYKNLLEKGYDDDQIQQVMESLKNSSAYGRDAQISMGDAIESATKGIKDQDDSLLSSAGVTKTVAEMWDDYAISIGQTADQLTEEQKVQAEVMGVMEATKNNLGDASALSESYAGQVSNLEFAFDELKVTVGEALMPILEKLIPVITAAIDWISENSDLVEVIVLTIISLAAAIELVSTAMAVWNVVGPIAAGVAATLGTSVGSVVLAMGGIVIAIVALIAFIVYLCTHWEEVKEIAANVWEGIKEKWGEVATWFSETVIEPVKQFFADLWEGIKEKASSVIENVKEIWVLVSTWFSENVITPITTFFSELWEGIKNAASGALDGIKEAWTAISDWFKTKVIDPIEKAFKGGINGMIGFVEGFVNAFIGGVNIIIDAINSISFDLPDFLGGGHIGFSLSNVNEIVIPRLARGAIIPANQQFMAILGDQKSGRNLEAPEGLIRQIMREELSGMQNGGTEVSISFEGSLAQLARVLNPVIKKEERRIGTSLSVGGAY